MDWAAIGTTIILSIVGAVITGLGTYITYLINSKIKDEKLKKLLNEGLEVVMDGVTFVQQTYVDGLKGTDFWDAEAMAKANEQALDYVMNHLTADTKKYLADNGKDALEWAKEQIEIAINKKK